MLRCVETLREGDNTAEMDLTSVIKIGCGAFMGDRKRMQRDSVTQLKKALLRGFWEVVALGIAVHYMLRGAFLYPPPGRVPKNNII